MPQYDSERPRSNAKAQHEAERDARLHPKPSGPKALTLEEQAKAQSGLLGQPLEPDQVV